MPDFQSLGVLAEEGLILKRWNGRAWFIACGISGVRNNHHDCPIAQRHCFLSQDAVNKNSLVRRCSRRLGAARCRKRSPLPAGDMSERRLPGRTRRTDSSGFRPRPTPGLARLSAWRPAPELRPRSQHTPTPSLGHARGQAKQGDRLLSAGRFHAVRFLFDHGFVPIHTQARGRRAAARRRWKSLQRSGSRARWIIATSRSARSTSTNQAT